MGLEDNFLNLDPVQIEAEEQKELEEQFDKEFFEDIEQANIHNYEEFWTTRQERELL